MHHHHVPPQPTITTPYNTNLIFYYDVLGLVYSRIMEMKPIIVDPALLCRTCLHILLGTFSMFLCWLLNLGGLSYNRESKILCNPVSSIVPPFFPRLQTASLSLCFPPHDQQLLLRSPGKPVPGGWCLGESSKDDKCIVWGSLSG
ncbi:hypothetical protein ACJIZ3_017142 [Penstemon smallii]|uniref:Uncharacterized protein n=1 Tax=Penstemon smallii TaxID=265156 RepID=A0ABD3SVH7_9LAMI